LNGKLQNIFAKRFPLLCGHIEKGKENLAENTYNLKKSKEKRVQKLGITKWFMKKGNNTKW